MLHDALNRPVRLASPPRRIVSLVPSITRSLADLGLDEEVVGVTTFCVDPPGWRERKRRVGGTKDVRAERVAELRPDLILANKEENERAQVLALEAIAPVYVTDVATVAQAADLLVRLGALVGREAAGAALAAEVRDGFAALEPGPARRVAYLIWRAPLMVAGGGTLIDDVLARAGLVNVFAGRPRYPAVEEAELRVARPEVLLLSSEPYPFREAHAAELAAVCPGARALRVPGEPFSWWGSRLRETPSYLRSLLAELD